MSRFKSIKTKIFEIIQDNSETGIDIMGIYKALLEYGGLPMDELVLVLKDLKGSGTVISIEVDKSHLMKYFPFPTEEEIVLGIINET